MRRRARTDLSGGRPVKAVPTGTGIQESASLTLDLILGDLPLLENQECDGKEVFSAN
jgi:hypothetical protein